jgi:hypothetical protein
MIQSFCQQFPRSVRTKETDSENYPFHVARANSPHAPTTRPHRLSSPSVPSSSLHQERSGRPPSSSVVECCDQPECNTVSAVNRRCPSAPASTVVTSVHRKTTPLDIVLDPANHYSQEIRDIVCTHVPERVRYIVQYFQLRRQAQAQPGSLLNITMALSKLLPQLVKLECKQSDWDMESWTCLLSSLEDNTSIRNLTISLPNRFPSTGFIEPLRSFLSHNKTVTHFSLFRPFLSVIAMKPTTDHDFTPVVQEILKANWIQCFTLVGISFHVGTLVSTLTRNTSLTEWNLEGC